MVVTPAATHFDMCRELLEMGKDVFVEKPITLVSSEAKKLAELAEKSDLVLQVEHIFRFDPASVWLRDAIAAGRFGRLKMLRARFSGFKRSRHDTGVTFADSIHFIGSESLHRALRIGCGTSFPAKTLVMPDALTAYSNVNASHM